jgi:hypothetical protein
MFIQAFITLSLQARTNEAKQEVNIEPYSHPLPLI